MNLLRVVLLGGVAAAAALVPVYAADVPMRAPVYAKAPQVWSWEGQYIGIHGGYGWATNDVVIAAVPGEVSPSGAYGGIQIGYNRHIARNWVLGYEIDVSFGGINATALVGGNATTVDFDVFGSARARLGYVQGPWMIYGTAGAAWAFTTMPVAGIASFDRPHVGYALGAGFEYAFAPHWSAKVEYLYAAFGETNTFINGATINTDLSMHTVRVGLNYRFANFEGPAPAMPVKAPVQRAPGWTGAYVGVHGGYGWGNFEANNLGVVTALEPTGGFGGFQTGYNWQVGRNLVLGLESDSAWGSIGATAGATNVDIDALGTVRARAGYAMNNVMIYGTGGLAWAHAESATPAAVRDQFYIGWTAGAGIEYVLAPRWSAKVEYLYANLGTINDTNGGSLTSQIDVSTIKVGLNFRGSILQFVGSLQ